MSKNLFGLLIFKTKCSIKSTAIQYLVLIENTKTLELNIKRITMNKMIVTVFDSENQAAKGLEELKRLNSNGDISIYAEAVLSRNEAGEIALKQGADQGPIGTAIGGLSGALIGMLAGPTGMMAGTIAGMYGGMFYDLDNSVVDTTYIDEISKSLEEGKTAIIIDAEEEWTAPLDAKMEEIGATVYRKNKSDIIDAQYQRESEELQAELKELNNEMKEANEDMKASIQKQIDKNKAKSEALNKKIKAKIDNNKVVRKAKLEKLKSQISETHQDNKKKLDKRMDKLKADHKNSKKKLEKAAKKLKASFA